jgi:hypothetical protein
MATQPPHVEPPPPVHGGETVPAYGDEKKGLDYAHDVEGGSPSHPEVESGVVTANPLQRSLQGRHMQMIAIGKTEAWRSNSN